MKTKSMFDAYLVYEDGRVQNRNTGRFLKPEVTKNGYRRVTLCSKGKTTRYLLHRLVAMRFLPNPDSLACVNHLDGDKANNKVSNLEWTTYSANEYHSYNVLGKQVPKGIDRWNGRYTDEDIQHIIEYARKTTHQQAADKFRCSRQYVTDLVSGKRRRK